MAASSEKDFQNKMFEQLMEALKGPAKDLVKEINHAMKNLENSPPDPGRDSTQVQKFYYDLEANMLAHPHFKNCSREEIDEYMEGMERYLTHKMYKRLFVISQEDIERDDALSKRFRALEFIKLEHLEVNPALVSDTALVHAIGGLKPMDTVKDPREKLQCILRCCQAINKLLLSSSGGDFGADDFTPVLIYVVIRAKPERLVSNLGFVERFRNQAHLTGEAQYYFTQLYGAATFIETMDASSLKVNPDEFLAHMLNHGIIAEEQLQSGSPLRNPARHPTSPFKRTSSLKDASAPAPPSTASRPAQPVSGLYRRQSEVQTTESWQPPKSVAELQAEGLRLVLQEEAEGNLGARHRYLYASPESLTVKEVHDLLSDYKELVLQFESLSLAVERQRLLHTGAPSTTTPALAPASIPAAAVAAMTAPAPGASSAPASASTPAQKRPTPPPGNLISLEDTPPQSSRSFTAGSLTQPNDTSSNPAAMADFLFAGASTVTAAAAICTASSTLFDTAAGSPPSVTPTSSGALSSAAIAHAEAATSETEGATPDGAGVVTQGADGLEQLPSLEHLLPPGGAANAPAKGGPQEEESLI